MCLGKWTCKIRVMTLNGLFIYLSVGLGIVEDEIMSQPQL